MYYIGIDIGGTNTVVGIVNQSYEIISKTSFKTAIPRSQESLCDDISLAISKVLSNANISIDDIASIGIGAPGSVNRETGIVEFSSNLFYHNWPLADMIKERTGKQTFIENDANAAAYAEYLAGAAKGVKNAIVITLGTGIGSGIIIDGKIYSGSNYNGAEIGHMVIEHNGVECSCGRKGCYEKYASTSALVRITKEFMQNAKSKDSLMFKLCSNDINKVSGRTAFTAAESNDALAKAVLDKFFDYLACGIINVINIFQPEILCIGGGISKEGNKLLDPIMERVKKERYSKHAKTQTKLCIAKLNNDAGIIGAAMLKQN